MECRETMIIHLMKEVLKQYMMDGDYFKVVN